MNVKNRKCIRKLSLKSLYANRRRNLIAIFAIALTTLLFTSMFTIVLSLNASYETYQFRQVGGYAHGTFKDVSPEQAERIAAHPKVKATGARKVIGITAEGVFAKIPAEISYMDANCTKWSYATPTTGRMPESGKEVTMDTAALQLLGVTPELGAEVTVSYSITDKDQTAFTVTDTFTLVGYWDYDELMPVHYINISRDYADDIEAQAVKTGLQPFRTALECHDGFQYKHSRADGAGGYRSRLHMGQLYRSQQRSNRRQLGIYLIPAGVAARSGTCDRHSSFFAAGDFHRVSYHL